MKKESYTKAKLCYIDKDSLKIQNKTEDISKNVEEKISLRSLMTFINKKTRKVLV